MIVEDPSKWLRPALEFHKTDTFRRLLPLTIMVGLYTTLVAWLVFHLHLDDSHPFRNITLMHGLLGFALSILLVFRTNTAYERWWEGRKMWGALVNCSRNLAAKVDVYLPDDETEARESISSLIGLFADELRQHLLREQTRLQLDERPHPEIPDLDRARHVPTQVASGLMKRLLALQREGKLSEYQLLLLNNEVTALLDICGACERIKNTPIPYSYTAFIKKFIVAYCLTLPLGYVFVLSWLAVPVVLFTFYVLASLELIAEQIEDPFGTDSTDLPLDRLAQLIAKDVGDILCAPHAEALPPP